MKQFWSRLGNALTAIRIWTVNLLTLAFIIYLVAVAVSISRQVPPKVDPQDRVLIIAPKGVVVDQEIIAEKINFPPDFDAKPQIQYRDLVRLIRAAAEDERLAAVSIDFSETGFGGITTVLGLAEELAKLRESGKPLIAYSDAMGTAAYVLASQADEVYLHPSGALDVSGLGGYAPYVLEFANKLKINIHNYSQGDYKSAAEMISRSSMSEADREQRTALYTPLWEATKARIAAGRGVEPEVVQTMADDYPVLILGEAAFDNIAFALDNGLLDGTKSFPEYRAFMMERFGTDEEAERETYPHIVAAAYLAQMEEDPQETEDAVAVVFAQGVIQRGKLEPGVAGADDIADLIREAYEKDDTRAIVLRVNSPGGGVLASEMIHEELMKARSRGLPVVISMGDIATSGGMYVSAPGDKIYAMPTTVTGSIGVALPIPTLENLFEFAGINFDGVQTSQHAGWGPSLGIDETLDGLFERRTRVIYERFVEVVAEGRDRDLDYINGIAGGRVWIGDTAKEIGLVDEFGNLEDAVAGAAEMAALENYRVAYVTRELPFMAQFLRDLMQQSPIRAHPDLVALSNRIGTLFAPLLGGDQRGVLMCSVCEMDLR